MTPRAPPAPQWADEQLLVHVAGSAPVSGRSARQVFEDLAAEHLDRPRSGRRVMFGRDCLVVDGHNIAFFHDDRLALRLAPERAASMLAAGDATIPLMGTRPMRSWVSVPLAEGPAGARRWRALVAEAAASSDSPA
jgi:hypothetical protein